MPRLGMGFGLTGFAPSAAQILLNRVPGASALYMPDRKLSSRIINGVRTLRTSNNDELDLSPAQIGRGELVGFVNEPIVTYESDFSAGVDGITGANAIRGTTARVDGISDGTTSFDNVLRYTATEVDDSGTGGSNRIQRLTNASVIGQNNRIKFRYFIPSGQAGAGIRVALGVTGVVSRFFGDVTGEWTEAEFEGDWTINSQQLVFSLANATNDGDPEVDDVFYIRDIQVTQLTSNGRTPILYDWSGNGIDATQTTVADQPFIATAGVLEEGLRFAGGQWLSSLPVGSTFFDPTTYAFSFSFWARTTTVNANQAYCAVLNDGLNTLIAAEVFNPSRLRFVLRKNSNVIQVIEIESAVSANTWFHYTGVHTGTQIILYKDGNEIGRENIGAGTLSALQYPFAIGAGNDRGTIVSFLQGSLTGFGIWPRVLTPAEINTVKDLTDPTA